MNVVFPRLSSSYKVMQVCFDSTVRPSLHSRADNFRHHVIIACRRRALQQESKNSIPFNSTVKSDGEAPAWPRDTTLDEH